MEQQRPEFTPEAVDEQLDGLLFQRSLASQDERFIRDLRQMYQEDEHSLARVWQRLDIEHELATPLEEHSAEHAFEPRITSANSQLLERNLVMRQAPKRPLVRVFSLLAAACVAALLVGSLLVVFNLAHRNQGTRTASQGVASTSPIPTESSTRLPAGIYVNDATHLYRLNVQTHQAFWAANLRNVAQILPAGNAVYILQNGGAATGVVKLDANTGTILWNFPLYMKDTDPKTQFNESVTNLVLAQDKLYLGWQVWSVPKVMTSKQQPQVTTIVNDIYVLNTADGKKLADYAHISADMLAIDQNTLVVSSQNTLQAYNLSNGQLLWHATVANGTEASAGAPSIVNKRVYVPAFVGPDTKANQTYIVAYDLTSGQQVWKSPIVVGGQSNTFVVDQNTIYVSTMDTMDRQNITTGHVYAYDVQSNKQLWTTPIDGGGASLVLNNGVLYSAAYSGSGKLAHLAALDAATGTVKWHKPLPDSYPQGFTVADGIIYASSMNDNGENDPIAAQLQAISAANGSLLWQTSQYGSSNMTATA